jgi:hypothetical protein
MLRYLAAGVFGVYLGCVSSNAGESLFKTPVISVKPFALDFGSVPAKTSVTNSILVENWGGGKLVGKVIVAKPFKIISGGTYRLGPADAQVVTVSYTPSGAALDTNMLKFTGGGGALVPISGKAVEKKDR